MSWIEKEEEIIGNLKIPQIEFQKAINFYFLYVDANNFIEKTKKFYVPLKDATLRKEQLTRLMEIGYSFKGNGIKEKAYEFDEIIACNITLDPQNLSAFNINDADINNDLFSKWIKRFPKLPTRDFIFSPTLFIFHELNFIYCILKEKPEPISLLAPPENRKTKKLRFGNSHFANAAITHKRRFCFKDQKIY